MTCTAEPFIGEVWEQVKSPGRVPRALLAHPGPAWVPGETHTHHVQGGDKELGSVPGARPWRQDRGPAPWGWNHTPSKLGSHG